MEQRAGGKKKYGKVRNKKDIKESENTADLIFLKKVKKKKKMCFGFKVQGPSDYSTKITKKPNKNY